MADVTITDYLTVLRPVLADAVGLEESEVEPSATILGDLGAESIDLLDVLFRVERAVGVKISATEIADMLQGGLSDDEFEGPGGVVTPAGLEQLRRVLPQIDAEQLNGRLVADEIMNLFTVQNLADMVAQRAAAAADAR